MLVIKGKDKVQVTIDDDDAYYSWLMLVRNEGSLLVIMIILDTDYG